MLRTQISLTEEDRCLLDDVASRTGHSIAALIRDAVQLTYGSKPSAEDGLRAMREGFGAWQHQRLDGAAYVEQLRSGRRVHVR